MNFYNILKYVALGALISLPSSYGYASNETKKAVRFTKDSAITAEIKSAYVAEKLFGDHVDAPDFTIHVETKNGRVYLTGHTYREDQLARAIKIAKTVKGVKSVTSKVTVKK